jgi:hypothetical protein
LIILLFIFSHNKPIMLAMPSTAGGGDGKSFEEQQLANDGDRQRNWEVTVGDGGASKGGERRGE